LEHPANASKRPVGWKSKYDTTETGNCNIEDEDSDGYAMTCMMNNDNDRELRALICNNPNYWLADTGTMTHKFVGKLEDCVNI
jgi:hypothetical protein